MAARETPVGTVDAPEPRGSKARGAVERKARKDLDSVSAEYRESAVAEAYVKLARRLDGTLPAREVASISREMRLCLAQLIEMGGVERPTDEVDAARRRREERDRRYAQEK